MVNRSIETKDFAIPPIGAGTSISATVDLSYSGHELIGAGITQLNTYSYYSGTLIQQSLTISGNIATISVVGVGGNNVNVQGGTIRAFYT